MNNWKKDKDGRHQHTVRLDKATQLILDLGIPHISDLNKLVNDALKHFSTCPLVSKDKSGYENRLGGIEARLTELERQQK